MENQEINNKNHSTNIENKQTTLSPIPEEMLMQAEFILDEIKKRPENSQYGEIEAINEVLEEALAKYNPTKHFDAEQVHYLWKNLKSKIKPSKNSDNENHDRISLARAIYVYSNFLEVYPEGSDRLPLDEAIDKYVEKEVIEESVIEEASKIFTEAKKYSQRNGTKLLPKDFESFMKEMNYNEEDILSIINYYRHIRASLKRIDLENKNELDMMAKALELNKNEKFTSKNEAKNEIEKGTRQNIMLVLTAPEKPIKKPNQR